MGGGRSYARPSSVFPRDLAAPEATQKVQRAVVTPRPEFTDVVFQPLGGTDGAAIVFLSLALFLGPDFMLAPLGIASEARLGFLAEGKLGRFLGIGGDWLEDREARLSSDAPLAVTAATLSLFLLSGLVVCCRDSIWESWRAHPSAGGACPRPSVCLFP